MMSHCIVVLNSGFDREDEWGYRSMEPNRCCITSIALVLLKTGISQPDVSIEEGTAEQLDPADAIPAPPHVNVNSAQLATAQKLLLFWRKPAVSLASNAISVSLCIAAEYALRFYSVNAGGMPWKSRRQAWMASLSKARFTFAASGLWS
jgi:hypothetical protein